MKNWIEKSHFSQKIMKMGLSFQLPIHVSIFMSELLTFCFVIQIIGAPCSYSPDLLDNKQASHGLWKSVRDGLDWQSMPRCWSVNTCNGLRSLCIVHCACFFYMSRMLIYAKLYELFEKPCFCEKHDSGYLHLYKAQVDPHEVLGLYITIEQ